MSTVYDCLPLFFSASERVMPAASNASGVGLHCDYEGNSDGGPASNLIEPLTLSWSPLAFRLLSPLFYPLHGSLLLDISLS